MRAEWGADGGVAAAAHHRKLLVENLSRCREALDEFAPDVVVVWGDDQYENFREEVIPPFCVLAYGDVEVNPFELMTRRGSPNAWGLPDDTTITLHGDADGARRLTDDLIGRGFDMAYSYRKRSDALSRTRSSIPNCSSTTPTPGHEFEYRIIPITVNCYGQHAIARRGGLARFADIADERLDPSGPTPARCFALGRAVAQAFRDTDLRVALVASSSWSHAFLTDKTWHIPPDTAADRRLYQLFVDRDYDDVAGHPQPRHRRLRSARNAQLVLPDRSGRRTRPRPCVVGARHHRCLQLQQVFCGVQGRRLAMRSTTATVARIALKPRTIDAGGIRTSYLEAGAGEPIVMLHGSGPGVSALANWQHNIGALAQRFRVLAPDIVGFGATERPDDVVYSLRTWTDHVWAFLDALGIEKSRDRRQLAGRTDRAADGHRPTGPDHQDGADGRTRRRHDTSPKVLPRCAPTSRLMTRCAICCATTSRSIRR